MPQMRITSEAHEAAMAAPMGAMTLIERFSLLVKRGARQEEEAYKAYVLGVIDMHAALEKVGVDKDLAAKVANAVIAGYK